ncbi:sporulation protein YabP [Feifania hominis]|uniref:Sporulation protein YabP n=1 Tax=Feifania hominis TaxID=2763660 RepID=A0A926DGS5_9FIRM|nr:sporulation protein YabP [Feifania hominis]MBC8536775.1 sporulation protein YabP [Feifania hominis]
MAEEKRIPKKHNIILENRKSMSISGIEDVDSFDEETVVLYTDDGTLVIRGSELHINRLNVESGDLSVEGRIDSLSYEDGESKKGGFFARLMR